MSSKEKMIFPIAIDLGAKNTGVYAAGYEAGVKVEQFEGAFKTAFVASVDDTDKGYQLLQVGRTATRHGRRCKTRNRQAKKLLCLLLRDIYQFDTCKHEVAISHFMNRRGYTYIENQVDSNGLDLIDKTLLQEALAGSSEAIQLALSDDSDEISLFDKIELISRDIEDLYSLKEVISDYIGKDKKRKKSLSALKDCVDFFIKERTSGAKHRREYIKRIKKDIDNLRKHPERFCRRLFHALNDHRKKIGTDMLLVFHLLICHINNFDLKLLNSILIKIATKKTREDIEKVLSNLFGKWICKQWRISKSNGKEKIDEIKRLHTDWKSYQANYPNTIINFLLTTPPELTIPPYESHTNRRPPCCQTLILNSDFLDLNYPSWLCWLNLLEQTHSKIQEIDYFKEQLALPKSGKGNSLISLGGKNKQKEARTLQFILDWAQDKDELKLNLIWSKWKKWRELKRGEKSSLKIEEELTELVKASQLANELEFELINTPKEGTFWHLVNSYYQIRRRAKKGRYFLHYDNTAPQSQRWQTEGKLVVLCTHRPQQLRHQSDRDICALLGLQSQQLANAIKAAKVSDVGSLFSQIRGLKTRSQDCYKAQKIFGIDLKERINTDSDLINLNEKILGLLPEIADLLILNEEQKIRFCERNNSLFIFAQLYQLVWGERSGFGKTCPLCSVDNASRMAGYDGIPVASRLFTLSMRVIDGVVKRLLNHQAYHIANRLWPDIEKIAKSYQAKKISIPIVIEQNRFDFTENLPDLKKKKKSDDKKTKTDIAQSKFERIKQASKGLCPYSGDEILKDEAWDIDHIIPRSGNYGVLNDEANLIYASTKGNREIKKNRELTLADLSPEYLAAQFGTKNTKEIENIITERLKGEKEGTFSFGRYSQFIALTKEQQIAFRHALFLPVNNPIRQLVISSILHTNKTKVNGTQRYMAQLLADILIKKAMKAGISSSLDFDYIEVSSNGNDENSTVALRRFLRRLKKGTELDLACFDKKENKAQQPYSHVIDATMAFMLALEQHQGEGALRIKLNDDDSIWGNVDKETGEENERLYSLICVPEKELADTVEVMPQSSLNKVKQLIDGKKPHQVYSKKLFKQNPLGLEFNYLAQIDGKLYKGFRDIINGEKVFNKTNAKEVDKNFDRLKFAIEQGYYLPIPFSEGVLYKPNKEKLTALIFTLLDKAKTDQTFNLKDDETELVLWLFGKGAGQLFYYTTCSPLEAAPKIISQKNSPYQKQWQTHFDLWNKQYPETKIIIGNWAINAQLQADWIKHCKHILGRNDNTNNAYQPAHSKQKGFTMKSLTSASGALALVKRKSNNAFIYQLLAIDTNQIPKEYIPKLAQKSPNLVLFDKAVIKKGYQCGDLKEKENIKGMVLAAEQILNLAECKVLGLNIEPVNVEIITTTSVQIKGIYKKWFSKELIITGSDSEKQWEKLKLIKISNIKQEEDVINNDKLKQLLIRACRSDNPIKINLEGENLELILPYKTDTLRKLVKQ